MRIGLRLFLCGETHLAKAVDRFALAEIFQLKHLANFDLAVLSTDGGIGKSPGPFHRLLPRLHLDDGVARDQLFRLGEGSVDYCALAPGIFDAPALRAWLEAARIEQYACLDQLLVIISHRGEELLRRLASSLGVPGGFDQNHESHCRVSFCFGAWRPTAGILGSTVTSNGALRNRQRQIIFLARHERSLPRGDRCHATRMAAGRAQKVAILRRSNWVLLQSLLPIYNCRLH